jgi:Divergent InlB B-repeat domain
MVVRHALFALLFLGCATGVSDEADEPSSADDVYAAPSEDASRRDDVAEASTAPRGVTVTLTGGGDGVVVSNPPGVTCPGDCAEAFTAGTTVTLTATPKPNSTFAGWSGGGCSGNATCVVTATEHLALTATFTKKLSTLNVSKMGTGTGTVTSAPAGIDCGATCAATLDTGTAVALTATPSAGSTFSGWSGDCTGTSATCNLTLAAPMAVVATFTQGQYALTVTKSGTGSGTVTSTPAGIACGPACTASFGDTTSVTLAAAAAVGSTFAGWSGSGCSGVGGCTVSMTAGRQVTAAFNASSSTMTCTTVSGAASCTNDIISEIDLGSLSSSACHDQCQSRLQSAGVTTGCWIVAYNKICYCRGGTLNLGGTSAGGTCN